eukprot:2711867-Rhodomonas_salina.1
MTALYLAQIQTLSGKRTRDGWADGDRETAWTWCRRRPHSQQGRETDRQRHCSLSHPSLPRFPHSPRSLLPRSLSPPPLPLPLPLPLFPCSLPLFPRPLAGGPVSEGRRAVLDLLGHARQV